MRDYGLIIMMIVFLSMSFLNILVYFNKHYYRGVCMLIRVWVMFVLESQHNKATKMWTECRNIRCDMHRSGRYTMPQNVIMSASSQRGEYGALLLHEYSGFSYRTNWSIN